ncbi:MAG: SRPBCC domain-containing protein [Nannocystaceae bacterium]
MNTQLDCTLTKLIPASPEAVFKAWLDPAALARFIQPAPGMEAPRVQVDARVGGKFSIIMKAGDQELPHRGEYKEIHAHERLVFTWISNHTASESTVTLTFRRLETGGTELTLHHVGFPTERARNDHRGGWTRIVELLATAGVSTPVAG